MTDPVRTLSRQHPALRGVAFDTTSPAPRGMQPEAAGPGPSWDGPVQENRLTRLLDADCESRNPFLRDVLEGLRRKPKELPCKYIYDERGSALFEEICRLPEYYLTRAESEILRVHGKEIAEAAGSGCEVVEYGSGSSLKTRILLDALHEPSAYYPIDISGDFLRQAADALRQRYPALPIIPVCADYTAPFDLPDPPPRPQPGREERNGDARAPRRLAFFPGSTIGNFVPEEAVGFLRGIYGVVGAGGAVLIGVDLKKDLAILEPAYDDAAGVTAEFNRNLLVRINRELGADFDLKAFRHLAFFNPAYGRMEMHLVSLRSQTVRIDGEEIDFEAGETIWTESSYKYTPLGFSALAARAGFRVERVWTDADGLFSVQLLVRA